jgi:predicted phosphodiesterase
VVRMKLLSKRKELTNKGKWFAVVISILMILVLLYALDISGIADLNLPIQPRNRPQKTPDLNNDVVFRFAVATDGHYGQPDTDYDLNHTNLVNLLNNINNLDLVIFTGDISHNGYEFQLLGAKAYFDNLTVPYYVVKGNHDGNEPAFLSVFSYSSVNYSFNVQGYHFVVINSSQDGVNLNSAELAWLDSDLTANADKFCFVFGHIAQIGSGETYDIDDDDFETMIASHSNVIGLFWGHLHSSYAVNAVNGTYSCYDGRFGGSWGTYYGYRVVEVYENSTVKTYYTDSKTTYTVAYLN